MGTPNSRPICSWDPPPQRHGFTLNGLGATALRAADSLMPQDRRCSPYPHSTGPEPTRQGVGPTRAGRRPVIAGSTKLDTLHPAGCSTIHGAPPLSASQAGFGLPAGCLRPRAGPVPTAAASIPRRKVTRMGATRTQYHLAWPARAVSVDLPAGQASGSPGHGWVSPEFRDVRPSRGTLATSTGLPGWQVLQVAQSVAIPVADHSQIHSESARLVPNGYRFRRFNS